NGTNQTATFSDFNYGNGVTGAVKVFVNNYTSSSPIIVSKSIITPPSGGTIVKMVEVSAFVNQSPFSYGIAAGGSLTFQSDSQVDAWTSSAGAYSVSLRDSDGATLAA